jgi:hypothetical protein
MPIKTSIAPIAVAGAALLAGSAPAGAGTTPTATASAVRQFEGTVVSVNRSARTFRLRDSERGTVRIKVTRSTDFERIASFRSLKRGMRNIEATVRRSHGRWLATQVERSGGGGDHGGQGGHDD